MNLADFVLSNFNKDEKIILQEELEDSVKATELIIGNNINDAMNKFNKRNKVEED